MKESEEKDWNGKRTIPEEQFCPRCGVLLGILWETGAKLLCEDELIDSYLAQCETDEGNSRGQGQPDS